MPQGLVKRAALGTSRRMACAWSWIKQKDMKITRDVPLSEVSDLNLLREVHKELGIQGR